MAPDVANIISIINVGYAGLSSEQKGERLASTPKRRLVLVKPSQNMKVFAVVILGGAGATTEKCFWRQEAVSQPGAKCKAGSGEDK